MARRYIRRFGRMGADEASQSDGAVCCDRARGHEGRRRPPRSRLIQATRVGRDYAVPPATAAASRLLTDHRPPGDLVGRPCSSRRRGHTRAPSRPWSTGRASPQPAGVRRPVRGYSITTRRPTQKDSAARCHRGARRARRVCFGSAVDVRLRARRAWWREEACAQTAPALPKSWH